MDIQQQLDRIVSLLDQLRATDPKAELARRSLREFSAPVTARAARDVDDWPDGAVRGMLEEVVETLWPGGSFPHGFGYPYALALVGMQFRWGGDAKSLATVLIEALEEKVNASTKA